MGVVYDFTIRCMGFLNKLYMLILYLLAKFIKGLILPWSASLNALMYTFLVKYLELFIDYKINIQLYIIKNLKEYI